MKLRKNNNRIDLSLVSEYEQPKFEILLYYKDKLWNYAIGNLDEEMKAALEQLLVWMGTPKPSTGLFHSIDEEYRFCSAAQKGLLNYQKELFETLRLQITRAQQLMKKGHAAKDLKDKGVVAQIDVTIERLATNIKELLAVPGQAKAA